MQGSHLPGQVANGGWFVVTGCDHGVTCPSSCGLGAREMLQRGVALFPPGAREMLWGVPSAAPQGRGSPHSAARSPRPLPGTGEQCRAGHRVQLGDILRGQLQIPQHHPVVRPDLLLAEKPSPAGTTGPGEFIQGEHSRGPATWWVLLPQTLERGRGSAAPRCLAVGAAGA